jgi:hypothetical protein
MDAFDRLSIICGFFTCLVIVPIIGLMGYTHGDWLMAVVFLIICAPLFWIGGFSAAQFITKPFVEKGLKGIFSWIVTVVLVAVLYIILGLGLVFLLRNLQML